MGCSDPAGRGITGGTRNKLHTIGRWYTAKEVCEIFNISRPRLSQLTDGRIQVQSKKEYSEMPAIPLDAVKMHLTGKRAKVMYNEKAIQVLKKYFTK